MALDPARRLGGLALALEEALLAEMPTWIELCRGPLAASPSAVLAHAPSAAGNASDFGLMLAWSRLAGNWAAGTARILLVCDDPWLFRHLSGRPGVETITVSPGLVGPALRLWIRGHLARAAVALRVSLAWLRLRDQRRGVARGGSHILVYGHPGSRAEGQDAYFGDLMARIPGLSRVLHVDCLPSRALALSGPRTVSLHGWGSPWKALKLPFARWRPGRPSLVDPWTWLIRRAAAIEGGTGQGAMISWQVACQRAWLADVRPRIVVWPWENHGWERALVAEARPSGARTLGYIHVPVYRGEGNYAPPSSRYLPDRLACCGPAARRALLALGHDKARLADAGAWRFSAIASLRHDPRGPLFVALPADMAIAAQMLAAVRPIVEAGREVLVRDHPLTPVAFTETQNLRRANGPLAVQDGLAAVLYASTSVGLEALLGGLPTFRFLPERRVGQGLPAGLPTGPVDVDADGLPAALERAEPSPPIDPGLLFDAPDLDFWRKALMP